jgi:hypothetical protein
VQIERNELMNKTTITLSDTMQPGWFYYVGLRRKGADAPPQQFGLSFEDGDNRIEIVGTADQLALLHAWLTPRDEETEGIA